MINFFYPYIISELVTNNVDLRVFYKSLWLHVLLVKVYPPHEPTGRYY